LYFAVKRATHPTKTVRFDDLNQSGEDNDEEIDAADREDMDKIKLLLLQDIQLEVAQMQKILQFAEDECRYKLLPLLREYCERYDTSFAWRRLSASKKSSNDRTNNTKSKLRDFIIKGNQEGVLQILLAIGDDDTVINGRDPNLKYAPIHFAASYGHIEILINLLQFVISFFFFLFLSLNYRFKEKVDALAVTPDRSTVLHLLVRNQIQSQRRLHMLVEILLVKNFDINSQNINGATPLHEASARGNITAVTILLEEGAQLNITAKNGETVKPIIASLFLIFLGSSLCIKRRPSINCRCASR